MRLDCVLKSTLNIVFTVSYYLELHNVVTIYYISHILSTNVKLLL